MEVVMSHFVGAAVALAFIAGLLQLSPGSSGAQTPDVDAYRQFIDAMNQGNLTRALAVFTDDAVASGFPPFCLTDCKGKAAIQKQLEFETGAKINLQMLGTLQATGAPNTYSVTVSHRAI